MSDSKKPTSSPPGKSTGLLILFTVLIAWTLVIAVGTWQTQASTDYRRPLIVVGSMTVFLGGWGVALMLRRKR